MNITSSPYVCPEIEKWITTQEKEAKIYQQEWPDMNCQVYIWIPPMYASLHIKYLVDTLYRCTKWIRSLPPSDTSKNKKWTIMIWLTPFPLEWCEHQQQEIGPCQVNSGETHTQKESITIRIYRMESLLRTVIHELLHACGWDRLVLSSEDHRYESENESLIEGCARILHCFWIAQNLDSPTTKAEDLIQGEFEYAWEKSQMLRNSKWIPKTHVVAYYLCSTAFVKHWSYFFKWVFLQPKDESWPEIRDRLILKTFGTIDMAPSSFTKNKNNKKCESMAMVRYQIVWPKQSDIDDNVYAPLVEPVIIS